jgi:hypothetical protein
MNNSAEYDCALVQRGNITLWISEGAISAWKPAPTGLRGDQKKFSDHAIETAPTLRFVFNLPLLQTEGFLRSVRTLMGIALETPDHTTLFTMPARREGLESSFHLRGVRRDRANEDLDQVVATVRH